MRILSIGNFGTGWDGSICDEEHIASALENLGHEVERLQREDAFITRWKYKADGILREIGFVLVAQWHGYPPDMVKDIKELLHCPVVFWAFDLQEWGQEWCERLIAQADLYLSKRIADSKYSNWQWLSQDFAPEFLIPHFADKDIDVLFTGSYLPWATERNETLRVVDEKFNLVIHSVNEWPGFKDVRPPIMDDGLPELYGRAKVILSIDHTLEAGYWSDRNAQIIVCGRKPLFRYIPLSEARFGERVTYFYNIEDCLKKIEEQLDVPMYEERTDKLYVKDRVQDLLTIVESVL